MLSRLHWMYTFYVPRTIAIALLFDESSLYGICEIDQVTFLFALFIWGDGFALFCLQCFRCCWSALRMCRVVACWLLIVKIVPALVDVIAVLVWCLADFS